MVPVALINLLLVIAIGVGLCEAVYIAKRSIAENRRFNDFCPGRPAQGAFVAALPDRIAILPGDRTGDKV